MDYYEFLKNDILCLLYDYGGMTAEEINSSLGSDDAIVTKVLFELLREERIMEVSENKYIALDELNVKRLKKILPDIF